MFLFSEKVNVLSFKRKEKKITTLKVLRSTVTKLTLSCKEKIFLLVFFCHSETIKVLS